MNNFGQYAILDGVKHEFEKEPSWWWKIKPVTSKMELSMSKYMACVDEPGRRARAPMEIAFHEIALTFDGTNIPADPEKPVKDGGDPIVKPDASAEQVEIVLGLMPADMLMEIWAAVGKSYPYWGPANPNSK